MPWDNFVGIVLNHQYLDINRNFWLSQDSYLRSPLHPPFRRTTFFPTALSTSKRFRNATTFASKSGNQRVHVFIGDEYVSKTKQALTHPWKLHQNSGVHPWHAERWGLLQKVDGVCQLIVLYVQRGYSANDFYCLFPWLLSYYSVRHQRDRRFWTKVAFGLGTVAVQRLLIILRHGDQSIREKSHSLVT